MRFRHLILSAALLAPVTSAFADGITISVTPYLTANAFGSPSYTQAAANAVQALYHGQTTYGAAGPTQFNAQSNVTSAQGVVTDFASWMGTAEPGGAFAQELGNRQVFGLAIDGHGTQFSIDQLSFNASSTDSGNALGFSFAAGHYSYSAKLEGVLAGPDGVVGTADDIFVTSGPSSQLVDAVFGAGSGASFIAECLGCSKSQEQQAIDDVANYFDTPVTFTGTYTLGSAQGSGTFNIAPSAAVAVTPEPSSLVLLGTGLVGLAGGLRRRIQAVRS